MAKRNSTRHEARKPKIIDVEGHLLTAALYADYERRLKARAATNPDRDAGETLRLGLSDFLDGYRPSTKISRQLLEITKEAMTVSLAIGDMRHYSWSSSEVDAIRAAGAELVKKLALELHNASAKLTAIAMSVEAEKTTKLQDWLARDQKIARIGRATEAAHGNS
jgi:hypothetical protein